MLLQTSRLFQGLNNMFHIKTAGWIFSASLFQTDVKTALFTFLVM